MTGVTGFGAGRKIGRVLGAAAAALLVGTVIFEPGEANAADAGGSSHGGGGGFHGGGSRVGGPHGGGFHGGGFHGGGFNGFHAGGFHAGGFHGGGFHNGGFHRGFHGGVAVGLGGIYAPYLWNYGYSYYGYGSHGGSPDYGYYSYDPSCSYYGNCPDNGSGSQPSGAQVWYYCSDPAGYYPYVTQCNNGWQTVPAS